MVESSKPAFCPIPMNLRSPTIARPILVLGLSLPLLVSGALATWLWTSLTAQPEGLVLREIPPGVNTADRHDRLFQARNEAWLALSRRGTARQIRISLVQVQEVMAHDIARINEDKRSGQVLQAIAVEVAQGRLRTTTRLNLEAIEVSEMNGSSRVALLRLLKRVPLLSQRSLVVAIEGDPVIRDANTLGIDRVSVQVGNFRWTMAEASRYLQVPQSYMEDIIRQELLLVPMGQFRSIAVEANALVVTGERTAW
jgi:hypothetical protein